MTKLITLAELIKLPEGTIFQMSAGDTQLNDYSEFTYPAELACLCVKGETITENTLRYQVIVPLQDRIAVTHPNIHKTYTVDPSNGSTDTMRENIRVWDYGAMVKLAKHIYLACTSTQANNSAYRDYINTWTLPK